MYLIKSTVPYGPFLQYNSPRWGHSGKGQSAVIVGFPVQSWPPYLGAGESHDLVKRVNWPQGLSQEPPDQALQPPATAKAS